MDALAPDPADPGSAHSLLTATQLAERFAVSRTWVYQAVEDDRLPYVQLGDGGAIRFDADEIDQWLEAQRRWLDTRPARRLGATGKPRDGGLDPRAHPPRRLDRV
jgi:excisionase family DNA binding protein